MALISETVSARGVCQPGRLSYGKAEGATVVHGSSSGPRAERPSQGTCVEALRPAWASWMPIGFLVSRRQWSTTRFIAASLSSEYRPVQRWVMRPSRVTAVASITRRPAPEIARLARWPKCQSLMQPSLAEYWHIGETTMRLGSVTPPSWIGAKSLLVIFLYGRVGTDTPIMQSRVT